MPVIGPYIAPIAGKITEYCVDDLIIPYIKEIIDITKGNIELTLKIIEGYKLRLIQWVDIMASNHPELKAIKDIIIKFVIHGDSIEELVKSFKELVIQVARELQVKAEVLLYDILYLN